MLTRILPTIALLSLASVLLVAAGAQASSTDPTTPPPGAATAKVVVTAEEPGAVADEAAARVAAMSVAEQAASVVMGHIPTADPATLRTYMAEGGFGGFLLMGSNVPSSEPQLRAVTASLTRDADLPPFIAIDEEGGDVTRLPWDDLPSALQLKSLPPEQTARAFAARGALLARAGVSVNFGIVADVTDDLGMFIYRRALGTTPEDSAARVGAAVSAEESFARSTLKHFPGHGAAAGDSHSSIPSTPMPLEQWRNSDAVPFAAGIDAGASLLMFGHLAYTSVDAEPASLSARWHEIARDELGFAGVSITDDLGMLQASGIDEYRDPVANAVSALAAGNDMVLVVMFSDAQTAPRIVDGIVAAVEEGRLPAERLVEAAERVTALRLEIAADGAPLLPCPRCAGAN